MGFVKFLQIEAGAGFQRDVEITALSEAITESQRSRYCHRCCVVFVIYFGRIDAGKL
ncbi:hypothetical protein MHBO_001868 [Bonamia ostreae]|uniref:Uncharacterized protein n=1 Tax=Bonamia ostreae TaxID=126728 RepID=A0ABV2AKH0_9EUKA